MDDGRKKLNLCLMLIVILAVCVGVIYWGWSCYQKDATVSEGTLIAVVRTWLLIVRSYISKEIATQK